MASVDHSEDAFIFTEHAPNGAGVGVIWMSLPLLEPPELNILEYRLHERESHWKAAFEVEVTASWLFDHFLTLEATLQMVSFALLEARTPKCPVITTQVYIIP